MAKRERVYQSYLFRMWVEVIDGEQTWRLSVEDPFTSERRGFATLEGLCEYLAQQMKYQAVDARSDQQKINGGD